MDSAQDSDLAHVLGDWSQSKTLSAMKLPLLPVLLTTGNAKMLVKNLQDKKRFYSQQKTVICCLKKESRQKFV